MKLEVLVTCASLVEIEEDAFLSIPQVKAFKVSQGSENYAARDGGLFTGDYKALVRYPSDKPDKYFQVPRSVLGIRAKTFAACLNLSVVVLCEWIKSIESEAFSGATNLLFLSIPRSVERIADDAFLFTAPDGDLYKESYAETWMLEHDLPYNVIVED